jgi:non-specific serine/threonine protein kinase/serine/threonine-protein kinase
MTIVTSYAVNSGWCGLLAEVGLRPEDVLRRAGLPDDLFEPEEARLSTEQCVRLWHSIEEEAGDPAVALRIGSASSIEALDPASYAAMCSPDLNTALERIAQHRRSVSPLAIHLQVGQEETAVELEWLDGEVELPLVLAAVELVFIVQLSRQATRTRICPLAVQLPLPLESQRAYDEYFGASVQIGDRPQLVFTAEDAARPLQTMFADNAETQALVQLHSTSPRKPVVSASDSIGPYRIIRLLGSGGMGSVYLAEQQQPIQRQVALKLIKTGLDSDQVVARFEAERQALALMSHPNIAQVYDAGATDDGSPYFVMEHIDGQELTTYCNRHKMTIRQRLELFLQVLEGVHHAHQKGIIHRDLKPGNILVASLDGAAQPKIIDFGIAKAVSSGDNGRPHQTRVGQLVGTVEFMSPEQVLADPHDLDVRSDVYALGVLLYLLLVDSLPFARKDLSTKLSRSQDPPRPSASLSTVDADPDQIATRRQTSPARLKRSLRGDLDWIVMRAIDSERKRRYPSVEALAEDIKRYLSDQVVLARPQSLVYRMRKFAARRTGLASALVLVLLGLLAGVLGITVGFVKASQGERLARSEADKARAINQFLNDMLVSADPRAVGREVRVVDVLDQVSEGIGQAFPEAPDIEASIRTTIGRTYLALGDYQKAEGHLLQVREIYESRFTPSEPVRMGLESQWANLMYYIGRFDEAEKAYRRVWEYHVATSGPGSAAAIEHQYLYGDILANLERRSEAEMIFRDAVEQSLRSLGESHVHTANAMFFLGDHFTRTGRAVEARPLLEKTLAIFEEIHGSEHPDTLDALNALAINCVEQRDYDAAERYFRRTLELSRKVVGEDHPDTLVTLKNLGVIVMDSGNEAGAEPLLREAHSKLRSRLGAEHLRTLSVQGALVSCLAKLGKSNEAEALGRELIRACGEQLGPDHPRTMKARCNLADVYFHSQEYGKAAAILEPLVAWVAANPEKVRTTMYLWQSKLASSLMKLGKVEEAERHLLEALSRAETSTGAESRQSHEVMSKLAVLYRQTGRVAKAEEIEQRLAGSEK